MIAEDYLRIQTTISLAQAALVVANSRRSQDFSISEIEASRLTVAEKYLKKALAIISDAGEIWHN